MSRCENLDGQCAKSWCNCDEVRKRRAQGSFAAPAGSLAHVHFQITTAKGNTAMIHGDPGMPEATLKALSAMMDALAEAVNRGDFKKPENADISDRR